MRRFVPLTRQSDILFQSIENAMLPGEAPVAVQLFADIRLTDPTYEIILFRANGVEAFSDNATIEGVNARLGTGGEQIIDWEFCVDCHANANEPHPYGDQNKGNEFRDYVWFPYRKP